MHTTTDLFPEAIHTVGSKEVQRIRDEMAAVRCEVRFEGALAASCRHLQDDPRVRSANVQDLLDGWAPSRMR